MPTGIFPRTEHHKAAISRALLGNQNGKEKNLGNQYGKANKGRLLTFSAEHRAKLSAAGKGRKLSAEHKAKIAAARRGVVHSLESRAKMSASKIRNRNARLAAGETPTIPRGPIEPCDICGGKQVSGLSLGRDHDHMSGLQRGLLCNRCNGLLGWTHDDPELLRKAAAYLEQWKTEEET